MPPKFECECKDLSCPMHMGVNTCTRAGSSDRFKYRMVEGKQIRVRMCQACGENAVASGEYQSRKGKSITHLTAICIAVSVANGPMVAEVRRICATERKSMTNLVIALLRAWLDKQQLCVCGVVKQRPDKFCRECGVKYQPNL